MRSPLHWTIASHPNRNKFKKKNMPQIDRNTIVGFFDESSPQTTANTQRLLSFEKPVIELISKLYKYLLTISI